MPGPPKTPSKIVQLHGNAGHRAINKREPKAKSLSDLKPPTHLTRIAKARWRKVVKVLDQAKVLTVLDADALELYCVNYSRWREAIKHLNALKKNQVVQTKQSIKANPWVKIAEKASDQCNRSLEQFGMTPAGRTRVQTRGG